jgi:hypothetical protein
MRAADKNKLPMGCLVKPGIPFERVLDGADSLSMKAP